MKKFITFAMALLLCCGSIATIPNDNLPLNLSAYAEETVPTSGTFYNNTGKWNFDIDTGTLTFSGTGDISTKQDYNSFIEKYLTEIKSLIVENGITSIPTFNNATQLVNVEIPSSITRIIPDTFENTPFIENSSEDFIILGDGILYKYNGDTDISNIEIPNTVKTINTGAVDSYKYLSDVKISESVENILCCAFVNCSELKNITIPNSVTYMEMFSLGFIYGDTSQTIRDWDIEYNQNHLVPTKDFTINGLYGSTAEKYANNHAFKFYDTDTILDDNIINQGTCGENSTWSMDKDYNVTISGTGAVDLSILAYQNDIEEYHSNHKDYVQTLTIEDGITEIQSLSGFDYLETLKLPNSVTAIQDSLLSQFPNLKTIISPKVLTLLNDNLIIANMSSFNIYLYFSYMTKLTVNIGTGYNNLSPKLSIKYYGGYSYENIVGVVNPTHYTYGTSTEMVKDYAHLKGIQFIELTDTLDNSKVQNFIDIFSIKKCMLGMTSNDDTLDINLDGQTNILDLLQLKNELSK